MESVAVMKIRTGDLVKKKENGRTNNETREMSFREEVAAIMRKDGASEAFIKRELTDSAVRGALKNNFSAESLAWALLQ